MYLEVIAVLHYNNHDGVIHACVLKSLLIYGKSEFALKYSNGKAMPSGFRHFYCSRVVLSTQKDLKVFQHQRAAGSGSVKSNR